MKKLLLASAVTVAVAIFSTAPAAGQTAPDAPASVAVNENVFIYPVGAYRVVLLSEGQGQGNPRVFGDVPADQYTPYLSAEGTFANATNAFAVIGPEGTVLFDTGVGRNLTANLAAAGITKVDQIQLTHMHGDHIGGMLRDGAAAFPGVPVSLSAAESDYWATREGDARTVLQTYRPQTFTPMEIVDIPAGRDGIFPVQAYGHTPGHTAFLLVSGGKQLLIWGDLTHAMAVQMPRPDISVTYDVDQDIARASRQRILQWVTARRIPVAGMHIPYPGIGTVTAAAEGYRFTPVE